MNDEAMFEVLSRFGHGDLKFVHDLDGSDKVNGHVSRASIPVSDARRIVDAMQSAGLEASWAPDNDDRGQAWLYVA